MPHPKNADSSSGTAPTSKTSIPQTPIGRLTAQDSNSFHSNLLKRKNVYNMESKAAKGLKGAKSHQGLAFHREALIMVRFNCNFTSRFVLGRNTKEINTLAKQYDGCFGNVSSKRKAAARH